MGGPPHKWSQYNAMKSVVPGTRFLPFKTPFKDVVNKERFTVEVLMRQVGNLGFVLNLVKTDRYYNPAAYKRHDIKTRHIRLEGQGQLPEPEQIQTIYETLQYYIKNESDDSKVIGVHCTHGVNRTGYIICRYMIEKLDIEPQDAIDRFQEARGHNFDHDEYTKHLLTLRPSVDHEAKAFHSIGGKIIPRHVRQDDTIDVDEVLRRRQGARSRQTGSGDTVGGDPRRQRRDSHQDDHRDNDHRRGSRNSDRHMSYDEYRPRRYGSNENHRSQRDRWEASSSFRDRSPLRRDRSPYRRDRSRYSTERDDGDEQEWLSKYLGPRKYPERSDRDSLTNGLSEDEIKMYLGPRRRTILEEY